MLNALSNLLPAVVWTITSGIVLTAGDLVLRSWLPEKWSYGFELTFLIYIIGVLCMMMSFFQQNIALATVAAVVVNAVGYLLAVYVIYGDTISVWQGVGIFLGLVAFAILELS